MERPRKMLPPFWLVLGLAVAWAFDRHLPLWTPSWPFLGIAGRVLVTSGLLILLWPMFQFLRARTGLVPFSEATTLVTGGLYKVTRNPMYLGMTLVLAGAGLVLGSLGALLPVPLFMLVIQKRFIEGEERFLADAFGDEYEAYRDRVRRWL